MKNKTAIYYDKITVKIVIPPGYLVELPLKSCVNTPFLNISNITYSFEPSTKHHFIGLIKYLPRLILNKYKITLSTTDENKLFQDYEYLYDGIYNNFVFNEGFITPDLQKYNSKYFAEITDIQNVFYLLINTVVKKCSGIDFVEEITNSPAQSIWFNCLFNELENVFFSNGLLGINQITSKKLWANNAVKNINGRLDKTLDGIEPNFDRCGTSTETKTCNESYILGIVEKIATNDDEVFTKLKSYYRLKKQFFRKYRDSKDYQLGYLANSGTYTRGTVGRITHNS